ncbi:MAG: sortase [Pseudonocardia sp.]|nr:sortase [Pseudonocardia sp.]
MIVRFLAAAGLLLALTACGSPTVAGTALPGAEPATATVAAAGGLRIPAIGVDVDQLVPLALDAQGQPEVPPEATPEVAGWYVLGPAPGDVGAAVILGHVNANHRAGVFARLHELQPGDRIEVDHGGEAIVFDVYERGQYDKDAFPTARVYGAVTSGPELRLITCGGALGVTPEGRHSYNDNIIIYAKAIP